MERQHAPFSPRVSDVRTSTPGMGQSQWTASAGDSRMHSVQTWAMQPSDTRRPIQDNPTELSDIAHRRFDRLQMAERVGVRGTFATTADADHADAQRKAELVTSRKAAHEARILKMISDKGAYQAELRVEQEQARAQQQAARDAQRQRAQELADTAAMGARAHDREAMLQTEDRMRSKREAAQRVAQDQIEQIQARKAALARERAQEKYDVANGPDFFARFGSSIV